MMKCQCRSLSSCSRPPFEHVLSFFIVITVVASNNHLSTTKPPKLRHQLPGTAFISGTHLFQYRRQRSSQAPSNAYLSRPGVDPRTDGSGSNGITVNDESWFLGDGGFAGRHLEDDDRISAKKSEEEFFRERSLTVYDQMREASLLLLAQQKVLAAEEAREEASRPRFVPASAGGSGVARVQKTRAAATGLLPPLSPTSSPARERRNSELDAVVGIPTDPAALSGRSLGVGGLDEELEEIRRRVCVPLAAPAYLLEDLGISPVRGLLLHGPPGCGKTLLARRLSALLTPRPPTVVSGPEILERFVGSSEANVRALFDYPPEVPGGSDAEQVGGLHVIVLDEFDSIGQKRGGGGKGNDGGDRVRDSVVNQLLARMDGFEELKRPTLLVALTNRIDLLDAALLRPGRFEVQIEIPGPDQAGREAILKIHTQRMNEAGRIETPVADDTPGGGTGYDGLISSLAAVTDGFTGAELAGLVRAAASFSLERAVTGGDRANAAAKCKVTAEDFGRGLADVNRSKISVDGEPTKGSRTLTLGGSVEGLTLGGSVEGLTLGGSVEGRDRRVGSNAESMSGSQGNHSQDRSYEKSKAVAEAAEGAVRFEDRIEGGLSPEDLASVQRLLLHEKEASSRSQKDEDDLLLDAAYIVAQRRRSSTTRAGNAGDGGDGKFRDSRRPGKEEQDASPGREGEDSPPTRQPTMKKFEHTGWFHTYE